MYVWKVPLRILFDYEIVLLLPYKLLLVYYSQVWFKELHILYFYDHLSLGLPLFSQKLVFGFWGTGRLGWTRSKFLKRICVWLLEKKRWHDSLWVSRRRFLLGCGNKWNFWQRWLKFVKKRWCYFWINLVLFKMKRLFYFRSILNSFIQNLILR